MEKEINSENINSNKDYQEKDFQDETIDIDKIFETLKRRKRILFSFAFFIFSLGALNTINQRIKNPIFKGDFTLLISDPIENSGSQEENRFLKAIGGTQKIDIATLTEVLKSPGILSEIASKYNMSHNSLAKSININSVYNKSGRAKGALKISLELNDPKKLELVLDELSVAYIKASVNERQKRLIDGLDFISSQEPEIIENINSIRNDLQNLREKNKFILPSENIKKTERIQERLAKAKLVFKEDSNLGRGELSMILQGKFSPIKPSRDLYEAIYKEANIRLERRALNKLPVREPRPVVKPNIVGLIAATC